MTAAATAAAPTVATQKEQATSPRRALSAALLGFFIVTFDAVVMNVALPTISHHPRTSIAGLQWVVDGYTLLFAAFLTSFASHIVERVGYQVPVIGGLVVMAIGLVVLGCLPASAPVAVLLGLMILIGLAGPLVMPPTMGVLLNSVPGHSSGIVSGVFNTSRQVGGALAIAVFGALLARQASFMHGVRDSLTVAAAVAVLAAIGALRLRHVPAREAHG